jgi:hypothetical protein
MSRLRRDDAFEVLGSDLELASLHSFRGRSSLPFGCA